MLRIELKDNVFDKYISEQTKYPLSHQYESPKHMVNMNNFVYSVFAELLMSSLILHVFR